MVTKFAVSDALGLSCVEYYFLAWLSQYYPVEKLYAQSFVPVEKIFKDFAGGKKYELYDGLPRVQDTAESCGITSHEFFGVPADKAKKLISAQGQDDLCLIRVNDAFFENSKRRAWREDHYVAVDKKLGWVNEYPLSEGRFTESELERVYGGAACMFFLKDLKAQPGDEVTGGFYGQDLDAVSPDIGIDAFESALGVLRVSRKRLQRFYGDNARIADILTDENALLDRLYFAACLQRVKPRPNKTAELFGKFISVIEKEKQIAEALK